MRGSRRRSSRAGASGAMNYRKLLTATKSRNNMHSKSTRELRRTIAASNRNLPSGSGNDAADGGSSLIPALEVQPSQVAMHRLSAYIHARQARKTRRQMQGFALAVVIGAIGAGLVLGGPHRSGDAAEGWLQEAGEL